MIAQEHSWVRQYESHLVCRAASGFQLAAVWLQKGWRGRASVVTLG